ncbi:TrlF family AAA-like ATPase [Flavobacterium sp. FlaQc-50]|uniref:TrlF family AAA-like ATPase n=1 Tax=unclassified Flavobacterium TaxID=196869 RepID=UPI0037566BDA
MSIIINKGSQWRKWDLHVHTPATLCSDYGGDTEIIWQRYFEELERLAVERNIKVIGINDYLFIDGYKKVLEYKKQGGLSSVELILPVIEFRLKEFVGSKELGRLNYHIIFADDSLLKVDQIETHFLSNLRGKGNLDAFCPDSYTWGGVITRQTLIDLGNHIIKGTPEEKRTNISPIELGFNNLNFELSKIQEILGEGSEPNTFLKGKYFKAIGKAEWEDFRWENSALEKKSVINGTHFVFSASPTVEQAVKGKDALKKQNVSSRLMHCSDSHSFAKDINDTNSKELGHCFTWIKADPTFEGLKQIIYEPEERIKIQKEEPESEKLDNLMIDEISFESLSDKMFTPMPIKLNKNLNVIIGGKSSGKSILLYKIGKTLYPNLDDEILKYKDSGDDRYRDLYDLRENDPTFNFNIKLFSGSKQSLADRSTQSSILPSIKYIPQNHLSNLVDKSRKNGATLKVLIRNLILEDIPYKKKYDHFIDEIKKNDVQRNRDIDYYFSLKEDVKKKEIDLANRGDVKAIQEGIEANKKKIELLNKLFSEEDLKKYNELVEQKNQLEIQENTLNLDFEKVKNFNNDLKRIIIEQLNKKKIVFDSIVTINIKEYYNLKYKQIEAILGELDSMEKDLLKNEDGDFLVENEFKKIINNLRKNSEKLNKDLIPFIEKQENRKQIEAIQKSISLDETKLSEIKQFQNDVDIKKQTLFEQKQKIFIDFENNFKIYDQIIEELKPRISSIEDQDDKVEIIGSVKYDFPKFYKLLNELKNNINRFTNEGFEYLYPNENYTTALANVDFDKILNSLKELFNKIEDEKIVLKNSYSPKEACKRILKDYFFDHWDVKSDNDDIHEMSTGKASFILLKLMIKLSKEKGPILIDQPEDNLDNRSVSRELVEYLKEKKKDRQIILVTHNPNIVVNADAENIIVANQKGQNNMESSSPYKFDYINGALENSFAVIEKEEDLLKSMGIREHIADIVEGGKDAFKKREEKYGF